MTRMTFSFTVDVAGDNEAAAVHTALRDAFPVAEVHDAEEAPRTGDDPR